MNCLPFSVADYELFAFLGPLTVILSDLVDFLIQFIQFLLIIIILRYKSGKYIIGRGNIRTVRRFQFNADIRGSLLRAACHYHRKDQDQKRKQQ